MDKTIKLLLNALKADPSNWETRRHVAEMMLDAGETDQGLAILAEAPNLPDSPDDLLFLGQGILPRDPVQAGVCADAILGQNSRHAEAHLLKARAYRAQGSHVGARQAYTCAIGLNPELADTDMVDWLAAMAPPAEAKPAPAPEPTVASTPAEEPAAEPKPKGKLVIPAGVSHKLKGRLAGPSPALVKSAVAEAPAPVQAVVAVTQPPAPPPLPASPPPMPASTPVLAARRPVVVTSARTASAPPPPPVSSAPPAVVAPHPAGAAPMDTEVSGTRLRMARTNATARRVKQRNMSAAVFGAGIVHAALVLACLVWVVSASRSSPPELIAMAAPATEALKPVEQKALHQMLPQDPSSSSSARAHVLTAKNNATADVVVPEVPNDVITDDVIGAGDTFGNGFGWGDGDGAGGGGEVQFFGEKQIAKRVAFVVDFSYSMASVDGEIAFIDNLKRELTRSITALPPTVRYAVIFFSGNAWTQDEVPTGRDYIGRALTGNPKPKLNLLWRDASAKNKQATVDKIKAMPLAAQGGEQGGGTRWLPGVNGALSLQPYPDLIYLLTDGEAHDADEFLEGLKKKFEAKSAPAQNKPAPAPKPPTPAPKPDGAEPKPDGAEPKPDGEPGAPPAPPADPTGTDLLSVIFSRKIPIHTIAFQAEVKPPKGLDRELRQEWEKERDKWAETLRKLLVIARATAADFSVVMRGVTYTGERAVKFTEKKNPDQTDP